MKMNDKEKQLTIQLLEAKIERITGKKVVYKEDVKSLSKVEKLKRVVNEMTDKSEVTKEELEEIFGGAIGRFMGTKWDAATAEKSYNQSYAKNAPTIAQKLGTDVNTLKAALIKFMTDNGGLAILGGDKANAQWDAATKSFKRLNTKGASINPYAEGTK